MGINKYLLTSRHSGMTLTLFDNTHESDTFMFLSNSSSIPLQCSIDIFVFNGG